MCVCVCNYLLLLSHSVVSDSFQSHGLQNSRLLCPLSPRACSNSCPLSSNTIQPSCPVVPFSSCLLSSLASGSFPVSQLFASGGQSGLPLYMCTHTRYSVLKKKEMLPFVTICMDLKDRMVSKISQTQKEKYCMISLICGIYIVKHIEAEGRTMVVKG